MMFIGIFGEVYMKSAEFERANFKIRPTVKSLSRKFKVFISFLNLLKIN